MLNVNLFWADLMEFRVLVVYSYWVQIATVYTTTAYITSILKEKEYIVGKMRIKRTPWLNIRDAAGRTQILLCTFEGVELELANA